MRGLWIVLLGLCWLSVSPALAQLYRWTDEKGKIHITDDPETIPPAYRDRARSSAPDESAPDSQSKQPARPPALPQRPQGPGSSPPQRPAPTSAAPQDPTTLRLQELERDIAAARQERQAHLDQLRNTRTVHTTPRFVRQRREMAETARALLAVEQRLDSLAAEVERTQTQLQSQQDSPALQRARYTGLDIQGHDATYWQQRMQTLRPRLQQAQSQRRELLTQLAAIIGDEERAVQSQGRELIQIAATLYQIEADLHTAEQSWQGLWQEALRAHVPPEWWQ